MKYILFSLFLLSAFSGFSQKGWQEFNSPEGEFRIMVPGEIEKKERTMETAVGELLFTTYLHQPTKKDAPNIYYAVSFVDYPENSIHSDSTDFLESFFHYTIDASVQSVTGDLRYVDYIELDRFPGRLWRVDYKEGTATIKTKAYMVGRRFYQVQVVMHRENSLNRAQDIFFDTFDLKRS